MKVFVFLYFILMTAASAITCAISGDYAPYQFSKSGVPAGVDIELIELYNKKASIPVKVVQMNWDQALSKLYYTDQIDCVWGMELAEKRNEKFLVSKPFYERTSSLFIRPDSLYKSPTEFKGKVVVGDKDSAMEEYIRNSEEWKGVRIRHTVTKNEALQLLMDKKVAGIILPLGVGRYLEKEQKLKLKLFKSAKKRTPVGVAVRKGKQDLGKAIQKGLNQVSIKDIDKVLKKWSLSSPSKAL